VISLFMYCAFCLVAATVSHRGDSSRSIVVVALCCLAAFVGYFFDSDYNFTIKIAQYADNVVRVIPLNFKRNWAKIKIARPKVPQTNMTPSAKCQ